MTHRSMTYSEIRPQILVALAELYEDPFTRAQFKRFSYEGAEQRMAAQVLEALANQMAVETREPSVARLTDIGYGLVRQELEQLRSGRIPGTLSASANRSGTGRQPAEAASPAKPLGAKKRILIVDDSKDDREMHAYFLSLNGFNVVAAADGEEAMAKARELRPDLIIMDLGMPGMSGWEAIRRLRGVKETRNIPVVVLTAHDMATAEAVGGDRCLTKPCDPYRMLRAINNVLAVKKYSPSACW